MSQKGIKYNSHLENGIQPCRVPEQPDKQTDSPEVSTSSGIYHVGRNILMLNLKVTEKIYLFLTLQNTA
jgi:hypothetical protein